MSRRHTSKQPGHRLARALVTALTISLLAAAVLPALAHAQNGTRQLEYEWQLLTYRTADSDRDPEGNLEPVPAGVGATLLLFNGGDAWGDAACSSYETTYSVQGKNLFIDPTEPTYVECDPASRAFDDVFYDLLWDVASYQLSGSILVLLDSVGTRLMALTRASIDDDPTAARWNLARIGGADGSVEPVINGLNPWIEFLRGGSIAGSTGCGSFIGKYSINDGTMDITDVHDRLQCGTEGASAQAEKIVSTFDDIARFEVLPAGLRLQDEVGTTRLALTPVIELDSRTWTPTVIFDANGGVELEGQELGTSAVKLHAQTADGGSICRPFTARGLRAGLALNVANIKPIGKCKQPKGNDVDELAVETTFLEALEATASHALRGNELEFKDVDGNTLMRLEPQSELVGPTWVVDRLEQGRKLVKVESDRPLTATFTDSGIVLGETGVVRQGVANSYLADWISKQATRIDVSDVVPGGSCRGKQQKKPDCKREASFLKLLAEADRYNITPTGDFLRLFRGTDHIMTLIPEYLLATDE